MTYYIYDIAQEARRIEKLGKKKWRKIVEFTVKRLAFALLLDECVIGVGSQQTFHSPNGVMMTRPRKRKDRIHEEKKRIADGAPGLEGARRSL